MMATAYSFITLVLCLLTGGGNDLLDYLPTEAFWKEKKVEVSLQTMVEQLADKPGKDVTALIADLGSPDAATRDEAAAKIRETGGAAAMKPLREAAEATDAEVRRRARTLLRQVGGDEIERGVRRLMAIRTLGELGKPEAVATLKPLLQSKELFEAEYAQAAIDVLEGRQPTGIRTIAPGVADDVWLLPPDCRTFGQLVPRRGSPLGFAEFMAAVKHEDEREKKDEAAAIVTRLILSLADKIGNARVDAATFGVSGTIVRTAPGASAGYAALVIRGRYHSEWVRMLAQAEKVPAEDVDGVEVFQPDGESAWMMPSDDVFVYLASDDPIDVPAKALAARVKPGVKPPVTADDATRKLVEAMDTKQILWAIATVTPEQKALPVAGAFDTMTLVGTRQNKTLNLKLTAKGGDAEKVKAAAEKVNKHAKESADFLAGMEVAPVIRMTVELLRAMKAEADGTTATLTTKLETTPAAILSLPFLYEGQPEVEPETPAHPRIRQPAGAAK